MLDEEQYDLVKLRKEEDFYFTPVKFSNENEVSIRQVNYALLSKTYAQYVERYEKSN